MFMFCLFVFFVLILKLSIQVASNVRSCWNVKFKKDVFRMYCFDIFKNFRFFSSFFSFFLLLKKMPLYANDCLSMLMHLSEMHFQNKNGLYQCLRVKFLNISECVHVFVSYSRMSTISYWLLFWMASIACKDHKNVQMNWIDFFLVILHFFFSNSIRTCANGHFNITFYLICCHFCEKSALKISYGQNEALKCICISLVFV